jgi:hypothetical protein
VHPAEHRRADDDPDHDLEDNRRQAHRRKKAEYEGCGTADGDDDEQVRERELHGAAQSFSAKTRYA